MQRKPVLLSLLAALLLGGCSTLEFPGVYRLPIEQGNIITEEMVAQLEPGLTQSQVEFIMGSPLVRDPFTPNRWDYLYNLREPGKSPVRKRVSVFFEEGRLAHFDSTVVPGQPSDNDEQIRRQQPLPPALEEPAPMPPEGGITDMDL